jgi:hypothetical protein
MDITSKFIKYITSLNYVHFKYKTNKLVPRWEKHTVTKTNVHTYEYVTEKNLEKNKLLLDIPDLVNCLTFRI